jgi:hypothetical protein
MREAEMADLKKQVDEVTSQAKSYANFDPVGEVRREFESTQHQIEHAITEKPAAEPSSPVSTNDVVSAPTVTPTGTESPVAAGPDADAAPAAAASEQREAGAPDAGGNPA